MDDMDQGRGYRLHYHFSQLIGLPFQKGVLCQLSLGQHSHQRGCGELCYDPYLARRLFRTL